MKLTPKQKKNIVALYATGEYTQVELGKKFKVSKTMIGRIVNEDVEFGQKVAIIKNNIENAEVCSISKFIEKHQKDGQSLIERLLDIPDDLIKKTSIRDRVGASSLLLQMLSTKVNNTNSGKAALDDLCSAIRSIAPEITGNDSEGEEAKR